jgi:hypothetical protein
MIASLGDSKLSNRNAAPAFSLEKQLDLAVSFGSLMAHLTALGGAVAAMAKNISPENIAATKANMQASIVLLDRMEGLARSGGVITDVSAAKTAFDAMLPKQKPSLSVVGKMKS